MSDEPTTDIGAGDFPDPAAALRRGLVARMPGDPAGMERAFGNAVRAAWVRGEPWAVEWVEQTAFGRPGGAGGRE
ncbi:hypothetical protein HZZ00_37970 (plasmid) [Streptomyces sp. NEAU-sy36]|uniref:hypothetical protein n=1 Tax=unclassified Streptomyces TaxID=2593676 RepID=UPI0015D65F3D|nr:MULTISPECIES: hypothetical protein [unclassified Streptomyces]QLJ06819.1 hypothetical protein HZZ00_37970 [Streptomyces sp. NEAU-sy36]